jgi:hypothetical protein
MNVLGRHSAGPNSLNSPGGTVRRPAFFAGSLKQEDDMPKYLKPKRPMKQKPVKPKKGKK